MACETIPPAEAVANDENLAALIDLSGQWIDHIQGHRLLRSVVLDMDSSVSPTHGDQEGGAYNGRIGCTCYHPLFVFNRFGDLQRCALRPGNVHPANGWKDVLVRVVARYRERDLRRCFRADAFLGTWQNVSIHIVPRARLGNVAAQGKLQK